MQTWLGVACACWHLPPGQLPENISLEEATVERELVFLGMAGIMDPPRPEVAQAISVAMQAGIRVIIMTGDAAQTALNVASACWSGCQKVRLRVSR